ncbi:MAG: halocyanin-like protein [Natronomonas sp.]|jgi:halocyanin-like protein
MDGESGYTRRGLLRATSGATAAVAVASAAGTAAAQTDFDGWLSDVGNYDGTVVDATGQEAVTVEVGVQANDGALGFSPAAVQVDPGTTVAWEWTGEGGRHNVVDEAGGFESELVGDEGATYEQNFETEGVVRYYCAMYRDAGMKGVVVVGGLSGAGGDGDGASGGNESGNGDGGEGSEGAEGGDAGPDNSANQTALRTMVAMLVLGILSPLLFLLLLRRRQRDESDQRKRYPR